MVTPAHAQWVDHDSDAPLKSKMGRQQAFITPHPPVIANLLRYIFAWHEQLLNNTGAGFFAGPAPQYSSVLPRMGNDEPALSHRPGHVPQAISNTSRSGHWSGKPGPTSGNARQ